MRLPLCKESIIKLETKSGVYIIYSSKKFGRLKGKSDIIYIGMSKNLRDRLLKLINTNRKHTANKRLERLRDYGLKLYFEVEYTSNYKKLEHREIASYDQEHLETPPLNHAYKPK